MESRPRKFASQFASQDVIIQPLKLNDNGKGKSAWINMKQGGNLFEGDWFRVNWAPKPGMDQVKLDPYTKFKLTLQLNPEENQDFIKSLKSLDEMVVNHFFEKRNEIWKDKAKFFTDTGALMGMYNPLFKEGKTMPDGKSYKPSFTLQVANCASLVDHLVLETKEKPDGSKQEQVQDVVWKSVFAKPGEKPDAKQPKFYLWTGKDDDGKDIVKTRVSVFRPDGSELTDEKGVPVKRWVSLQDIKAGCLVRPVFKVSKVYQVQGFGAHLQLEAIIIKPSPPKESADFEGVKISEEDDAVGDARVLSQLETRAEIPEDAAPDVAAEIPAPDIPEPRKRPLDSPSVSRKKKQHLAEE